MSLRKYFVFSVILTFCVIVLLSSFTIWGCMSIRKYLLPESNDVFLIVDQTYADGYEHSASVRVRVGKDGTELPMLVAQDKTLSAPLETKYKIERIENSMDSLSPKRKVLYYASGVSMIVFPFVFSITGILICGFHFYKHKLAKPLQLLEIATQQIAEQNLDFQLQYDTTDEMGQLCSSFEQMRTALYENYRNMWNMLEERKLLQASIAHDLRNPIAVIQGYTEYLEINLEKGNLSEKRITKIIKNIHQAVKRLEHYTESVRTLNQMEDIELEYKNINFSQFISNMMEDFQIVAEKENIHLRMKHTGSKYDMWMDVSMVYRILENLFYNALRYAKENIEIDFVLDGKFLSVTITDDGAGFSENILAGQNKMLFGKPSEDGHLGMGLAISRILCKKHGGSLEIYNNEGHHAVVKINILL